MAISLNHIDTATDLLLQRLKALQNADGSFTTYFLQEHFQPEAGWMAYPDNSPFCTASAALPLVAMKHGLAEKVLHGVVGFLKKRSLKGELWRFADLTNEYTVPYDSDSTALASFLLERAGDTLQNKRLLALQLNSKMEYDLWIRPKQLTMLDLNVWLHNRKAARCIPLQSGAIAFGDSEFTVTCNNLLYLGKNENNRKVWGQVHRSFDELAFSRLYYPSLFNAVHAYSRLFHHHPSAFGGLSSKALEQFKQLKDQFTDSELSLDMVLLCISVLYFNVSLIEFDDLFHACFERMESETFDPMKAFYCSNLVTDVQPDGVSPNTYFGSPAITWSLHLEFLNLYRLRFHGADHLHAS